MSSTIEDRVILILKEGGEPHGYWSSLEQRTGISAQRWRKAVNRLQRPTPDMIEMVAKLHPKYAFWLATGITDAANGHIAPINALTFPERLYHEQNATNEYFCASIKLAKELEIIAKLDLNDNEKRIEAYERALVFTQYHGSWLVDSAYELSKTEEYKNLHELLSERENERKVFIEKALAIPKHEEDNNGGKKTALVCDSRIMHQSSNELFWRAVE